MADQKGKAKEAKVPEKKDATSQVIVKVQKMPDNLAAIAVQTVVDGLEKFNDLHASADYVKTNFEKDNFIDEETNEKISTKGVWHCILGRKFGSFVTFAEGNYIFFYIGQLSCLLWKSS